MIQQSAYLEKFLTLNKYRWVRHTLFWLVMYLDEWLSFINITPALNYPLMVFVEMGFDMALVYLNIYLLVPHFLFKRKFISYSVLTIGSLLTVVMMDHAMYFESTDSEFLFSDIIGTAISTSGILSMALAIKILKQYYENNKKVNVLQNLNLKNELHLLKEQINPHFIFNALNSIYIQSKKNPLETPETLLDLSDLMRYHIYDCRQEKISLQKEFDHLQNYVNIERKRHDNMEASIQIDGDPKSIFLPPLLFLPLIENAFKHSRRTDGKAVAITIQFLITEDQISLEVHNNKDENLAMDSETGGIGISNLKKRLAILYPGNHELKIQDLKNQFNTSLHIKLIQ